MILKIIIIVTLGIILRHHLAFLRPHWPVLIALMAGALAGYWVADFLIKHDVNFESLAFFGLSQEMVKPLASVVGALVAAKPLSSTLHNLFPYTNHRSNDVR